MIDVCMLGNGGHMPLPRRWLSSMLIRSSGETALVDAGEGTQISWRMTNWSFINTSTIFLTHVHADHTLGLPGVLFMLLHAGRTEPVNIYGPVGTSQTLEALTRLVGTLPFPLKITELEGGEQFSIPGNLDVTALALQHRIPCLGYSFERKRARKFQVGQAEALNIPVEAWKVLQQEEPVRVDDTVIEPDQVLGPARRGVKVTYMTDTNPISEMIEFAWNSDLLVCEGMYGADDMENEAERRGHMTMQQAAEIARDSDVERLWITHLSPRITNPLVYLHSVREIFSNSEIAQPHNTLTLQFQESD